MQEDLYAVLGVERGTEQKEIKKAYRKLARELHPDKNKDNKVAEERFKKVSAAYAVLSDKKKRQMYDQYGIDGLRDGFDPSMWNRQGAGGFAGWPPQGGTGEGFQGGFSGFGALEDIFEGLFGGQGGPGGGRRGRGPGEWGGGRRARPTTGGKIKTKMNIELMDAVLGKELQIVIPIENEEKRLSVTVPKGIESGQSIRLKGQGQAGVHGGPSGDLLLEVSVRTDKVYERIGMDLYKKEELTIGQAYNGAKLPVQTPWGEVNMSFPSGTQGGTKLRLKGKGIKKGKKDGDLYLRIAIKIPTSDNKKTKDAIEALEKQYGK
jgi:curved DNA-binding protein